MRFGARVWATVAAFLVGVDARQPLAVLTDADLAVPHADAVEYLARALALQTSTAPEPDLLALRTSWDSLPPAVRDLLVVGESFVRLQDTGIDAAADHIESYVVTGEAFDVAVHHQLATLRAVSCSHGTGDPQRWREASERLAHVSPDDGFANYQMGCALLACGASAESVSLLRDCAECDLHGRGLTRLEVASALVKAAVLASDGDAVVCGIRRARRAMRRKRPIGRYSDNLVLYVALQVPHPFDHQFKKQAAALKPTDFAPA
jgi:hypothetical protein